MFKNSFSFLKIFLLQYLPFLRRKSARDSIKLHHIMTMALTMETCSICQNYSRDQKCLKNVMHHLRPVMFFCATHNDFHFFYHVGMRQPNDVYFTLNIPKHDYYYLSLTFFAREG